MYRASEVYEEITKTIIDIYLDYDIKGFPIDEKLVCRKLGVALIPYSGFTRKDRALLIKKSQHGFYVPETANNSPTIFFNDSFESERRLHNMGSRGAFESVDLGNFAFKEGGQHYKSIGTLSNDSNVKVIIQDSKSVKAPEYSHTPGRIYAVVKDGQLKHLAYYDDSHKQAVSIDFAHEHQGVQPHRHVYLNHDKNSPGIPPTASEDALIKKIKKEFHLR